MEKQDPTKPNRDRKPPLSTLLLLWLGITFFCCAWYLGGITPIPILNLAIMDGILTISSDSPPTGQVLIIDIDDETLKQKGQWPWPRYRLSRLIEKITSADPAAVGLEILPSEPDRTSPGIWLKDLNQDLGVDARIQGVAPEYYDNDALMADAVGSGPVVLGFKFLADNDGASKNLCLSKPLLIAWRVPTGENAPEADFFHADSAICPLPVFCKQSSGAGFLNASPDTDGKLRRSPLIINYNGAYYPSLPLAVLMRAKKARQMLAQYSGPGIWRFRAGGIDTLTDSRGQVMMDFYSRSGSIQSIPAHKVMNGDEPLDLSGKLVFVGISASGVAGVFASPGRPILNQTQVHARVAESLLSGFQAVRPGLAFLAEVLTALFSSLILLALLYRFGVLVNAAAALLVLGLLWACCVVLQEARMELYSPLLPTMSIVINFMILSVFTYWHGQKTARMGEGAALVRLNVSQTQLNSIINTIPDIVYRLDPEGRITYISAAVAQYGRDPKKMIGQKFIDLVLPEDRGKSLFRVNERRTGQRATQDHTIRLSLIHKNSAARESFSFFTISAQGLYKDAGDTKRSFIGTQGIARDITTWKMMEQQLAQARKMEAVGTLASGVAHDFNNILQGIRGYANLLPDSIESPEEITEFAREIDQATERGADLVRSILTFSRKMEPALAPVDLNKQVHRTYRILSRTLPKMISIHIDLDPSLYAIMGDPTQLEQVFLNLASNARDAMPEGGSLTIATRNLTLEDASDSRTPDAPAGEYVSLTIADTGTGISAQDQERIFDPFFTTKEVGSGTGLGLSTVYGLVRSHHGYIRCSSDSGKGTTFTMLFPVLKTGLAAVQQERKQYKEKSTDLIGILVVDDEPATLRSTMQLLETKDFNVLGASNGEEAIEVYSRKRGDIDMVILDMGMPGMGGMQCLEQLILMDPGARVIVASGYQMDELKPKARELGALGFLPKPYSAGELLQVIGLHSG